MKIESVREHWLACKGAQDTAHRMLCRAVEQADLEPHEITRIYWDWPDVPVASIAEGAGVDPSRVAELAGSCLMPIECPACGRLVVVFSRTERAMISADPLRGRCEEHRHLPIARSAA